MKAETFRALRFFRQWKGCGLSDGFQNKGGSRMIIQSSNMEISSSRNYRVRQGTASAITFWGEHPNEDVEKKSAQNNQMEFGDLLSKFEKERSIGEIKSPRIQEHKMNSKFQMLDYLWKLLFSKNDLGKNFYEYMNQNQVQEFGGEAIFLEYHEETEHTTFQAKGNVKTADGKSIDFKMDVSMTRSFMEYAETKIQFGAPNMIFCDPLVMNLGKNVGQMSDQKILFDLDSDGVKEEISTMKDGSGFLSLDQNGNGEIDNGMELFGTKSGDGFADLAHYDLDHNGWIDENDPVFDKLKIFFLHPDGRKELVSLKKMDVGAISLQNLNTEFAVKESSTNQDLGRIRKTGIFLYESGQAGTIQHVDVVKKAPM